MYGENVLTKSTLSLKIINQKGKSSQCCAAVRQI